MKTVWHWKLCRNLFHSFEKNQSVWKSIFCHSFLSLVVKSYIIVQSFPQAPTVYFTLTTKLGPIDNRWQFSISFIQSSVVIWSSVASSRTPHRMSTTCKYYKMPMTWKKLVYERMKKQNSPKIYAQYFVIFASFFCVRWYTKSVSYYLLFPITWNSSSKGTRDVLLNQ